MVETKGTTTHLRGQDLTISGSPAVPTGSAVHITIAQTATPAKDDSGLSVGDVADSAAAAFGAVAALLAFMSIRQVRGLASATQSRESRMATLNILTAGPMSLGELSKPVGTALAERSSTIASVLLTSHGAFGNQTDVARAIAAGRLFDTRVPFTPAVLELLADWYGSIITQAHRDGTAAFLNKMEETCTSVLRGILDLTILDRSYGTLLRSTYREVAQAIYVHRRTSSYRTLDQFERVMDLLLASDDEVFRIPGLFRRLVWLPSRRRRLAASLRKHGDGSAVDAGQLEDALISSGLLDQETAIRAALGKRRSRLSFERARRSWWQAVRRMPRPDHVFEVVVRAIGSTTQVQATVHILNLGSPAPLAVGTSTIAVDVVLDAIPVRLFHPRHLRMRGADGHYDGPKAIFVCRLTAATLSGREVLRRAIRMVKSEINTSRRLPFLVPVSGTPSVLADVQQTMSEEGGMLVHADVTAARIEALWLF